MSNKRFLFVSTDPEKLETIGSFLNNTRGHKSFAADGSRRILKTSLYKMTYVMDWFFLPGQYISGDGFSLGQLAFDCLQPSVFDGVTFFEQCEEEPHMVSRPFVADEKSGNYFPETSNLISCEPGLVAAACTYITEGYSQLNWFEYSPETSLDQYPTIAPLIRVFKLKLSESLPVLAEMCYAMTLMLGLYNEPGWLYARVIKALFQGICRPYGAEALLLSVYDGNAAVVYTELKDLLIRYEPQCSKMYIDDAIADFIHEHKSVLIPIVPHVDDVVIEDVNTVWMCHHCDSVFEPIMQEILLHEYKGVSVVAGIRGNKCAILTAAYRDGTINGRARWKALLPIYSNVADSRYVSAIIAYLVHSLDGDVYFEVECPKNALPAWMKELSFLPITCAEDAERVRLAIKSK